MFKSIINKLKNNIVMKILFVLLTLNSLDTYSKDISLEEIIELKEKGLITEEEFNILKNEAVGSEAAREDLYDLNINGKLVSRAYKVLNENGREYLPVKEFFKYINFTNYRETKENMIVYLGTSLREEKISFDGEETFFKNNEIYMEVKKFSEVFLKDYTLDKAQLSLRVYLAFDTPKEIIELLDISKGKLTRIKDENDILFKSERQFFDLGYARFQLGQNFNKSEKSKKYKSDWDGSIGYQGTFLYGQLTGDYDLRENELDTVRLEYVDIWEGHNLDIENRSAGKKREWGLSFYKDEGFYETSGGQIVIRETVPLGSRVELIYMGTPIEIKDSEDGVVEFDNPLVRTDKTYILKIYEPNGKIYEKEIRTVQDYNLQKKHEIEYKIGIDENKEYKKYETDIEFFYGITDKLTIGAGYSRDIEELEKKENQLTNEYLHNAKLDLVYGAAYNGLSYIFNVSGVKTLNNYKVFKENGETGERKKISLKDRYSYKYLNQLNYGKWQFIYENENFGKYYEDKNIHRLDLKYDLLENTDIGYRYETKKYREGKDREKFSQVTADSSYSWNKFLFSFGTAIDLEKANHNEYRASIYYTGWERVTGTIENAWFGDDYESKLTMFNNNFGGYLDFTTELVYSKKDKEKVSFKFALKLDDWLKLDTAFDNSGTQHHRIGIDKVIDLKNPSVQLNSLDNSRVKIITFVDSNNNNLYDKGEDLISGVQVMIGNQSVVTDANGKAMIYGLGNGMIYDMKVDILKPSFTLGNNRIQVKNDFSSTIEAHIPIKPMLTLSGNVTLDESLGLKGDEKEEFYNNLIVELKDLQGNVIETTAPDNEGIFDISGLFPKDYYIEVTYVGTKYDLKTIREEIELQYSKNSSINTVLLKISNKNIAINTLDIKKNMARLRR